MDRSRVVDRIDRVVGAGDGDAQRSGAGGALGVGDGVVGDDEFGVAGGQLLVGGVGRVEAVGAVWG